LRQRGNSFPPQPWGVHQTGSTPASIDSPPFAAGCHDQTEAPYERGPLVVTRTSVTRSLIAQRRCDNIFHRLDRGEHAFASSIPLSRKSAARERAVPGGRHLLQSEGP